MVAPFVVTLAVAVVVGFVVGRWFAVVVPAVVAVFYAGLNAGWWGDGAGDGWPYAMAILMIAGVAGASLGALARGLTRPRPERVGARST